MNRPASYDWPMAVVILGREQVRAVRRDPAARVVVAAWRRLTGGGGRTLVACSGGADSSALVIALAAGLGRKAAGLLTVAHVVHDMRPREETLADRDAARSLAAGLGLEFVEAEVSVRGGGAGARNAEAAARRERYAALRRLAREAGIGFVATAHHGGDQVESVLMGLLRGSGPRGLSGAAPSRQLAHGVRLVRPMLGVGRADCERICRLVGWAWREDTTNLDITRLRSALRHGVVRELVRLRPRAEARIAAAAELLRDAAGVVEDRAAAVVQMAERGEGRVTWRRADLAQERAVVVGETLRMAAAELTGGRGRDRLTLRAVGPAVRAIRGEPGRPREFAWRGVVCRVTSRRVSVERRTE